MYMCESQQHGKMEDVAQCILTEAPLANISKPFALHVLVLVHS